MSLKSSSFLLFWSTVVGIQCSLAPLYPDHGPSAFIRFLKNGYSFPDYPPMLDFLVETSFSPQQYDFEAVMDSGSTGVAISAQDLGLVGADLGTFPEGSEYLSSSRRLWEGYWVPSNLTFNVLSTQIKAHVPILVVTQNSTCLKFVNGSCSSGSKKNITQWPTGIKYMGMGFGRGSGEQPQALPDKVPFTNIVSSNEAAVKMHAGYILSKSGITVGLTPQNTRDFAITKLDLRHGSMPIDWQMANMSISVDDSAWNAGQALFDTGIDQSYVRVDSETYVDLPLVQFQGHRVLRPGTALTVLVGNSSHFVANYTVVSNDSTNPLNPSLGRFIVEKPSKKGPFINTGRHFYHDYEIMFDAECGWFGIRKYADEHIASAASASHVEL